MKYGLMFTVISALITSCYASCNKDEVMKLVDKGFSKSEIVSICEIHQQSDNKHKLNLQLITPGNDVCSNNGGTVSKNDCKATWSNAKKICRAAGGRLPTIDEYVQIIKSCGGHVVDATTKIDDQLFIEIAKKKYVGL